MAKMKDDPVFSPPRSDAYTGILLISFLALVGGSIFLYLDWNYYKGQKPPDVPPLSQAPPAGQPKPPAGNPPVVPPAGQMGGMAGMAGQMGVPPANQAGAAGRAGMMGGAP